MTNKKSAKKKPYDYDAIVIGTGPGGEGAAMELAKKDKNIAVIERYKSVGGGCTHWGTIPSKALRQSVSQLIDYNSNPLFSDINAPKHLTFPKILSHASAVISKQVELRTGFYNKNRIKHFTGQASFVDANTISISKGDGTFEQITAKQIVIATGSHPYRPSDIDFTHDRVYDSDTILSLQHDPRHIIIYGAGVIGSEYACIFKGLGVKVDLINTRDRLLSFLDDEMSDSLSYHLWNNGVVIRHGEQIEKVEATDHAVTVHLESGKKMRADCLLFANGRTGNTQDLKLENAGLSADGRGQLSINDKYQTDVENIYAVGDVIGYPSLASAAYDQGRLAASAMIDKQGSAKLIVDIPTGIYTIPEISSVGKTEQELTEAKIPYEVGRSQFKHLARAQISNNLVGSLKILFHRETKEILGIHCFGENAAEIIHIGQAIMEQKNGGNTIEYFIQTTFNYPTMAEAFRVAALNGLNRLF